MDYEIRFSGLNFHAKHGLYEKEKEKEQLFKVDVSLIVPWDSSFSDDIKKVINYEEIFNEVKEVMELEPFNLIESLAEEILNRMEKYNPIKAIVTIHKPETELSKNSDDVAISLSKSFG